ncbi:TonB-dependent receptor [Methylovulum sp.]|uniref:TonB-dependent receptor domain-containing protein n=1 Tax=Methylovulum sp. TaxID=1916980 RepID=UPI0026267BEA|nr:TonB-dependent receptor [Methylovulum sp.]MDD5123000.1 TonB-dependent receptor [Methylovulum sp.]
MIWNPLESTTFKLLYSSTFLAPNASELEYNKYYHGINTDIQEERIKSYEGIVEWHSADGLKLLGSLFHNNVAKVLVANGPGGLLANEGKFHIYAAEWEAEQRWNNGRLLKASYTYSLLADEPHHGVWSLGSPQNMLKLHHAEPLFNNFAKLGVESIYIGDRKAVQGGFADGYA